MVKCTFSAPVITEIVFGKILIIDPSRDMVTDTIDIGGSPGGLDVSSAAGIGYVSSWGLGLLSYNTENYLIYNAAPDYLFGKGGSGLMSDEQGNLYVAVWEENRVVKIDKTGTVLDAWPVGVNPQSLAVRLD